MNLFWNLGKHQFTVSLQLNGKGEEPEDGIYVIVEAVAYSSHVENPSLMMLVAFVSILHVCFLFLS